MASSVVRRVIASTLVAVFATSATSQALADPRRERGEKQERMRDLREEIRQSERESPRRDAPPDRRDSNARPAHYERSSPENLRRLSPEEREQLRRDVRDAGREVYRRR